MDVIILAGGKGTRLQGVIGNMPKCLALIAGKPFIWHLLNYLKDWEFNKIILSVGYQKEMIISYFNTNPNDRVLFAEETEPLGTGGAIRFALGLTSSKDVLVINGDTLFKIDLSLMIQYYHSTDAEAVIALRMVNDIARYGEVIVDDESIITSFNEKSDRNSPGLINGGIYLLNRTLIEQSHFRSSFSFEKDFLPDAIASKKVHGIMFNDYFIDIGVPGDLEQAQSDLK